MRGTSWAKRNLARWPQGGSPPGAPDEAPVRDGVHDEHEDAERDPEAGRERLRVKQRDDVVVDEAAFVPRVAGAPPQPVLERRQRAGPAGELDGDAPDRGRDVGEDQVPPPERE